MDVWLKLPSEFYDKLVLDEHGCMFKVYWLLCFARPFKINGVSEFISLVRLENLIWEFELLYTTFLYIQTRTSLWWLLVSSLIVDDLVCVLKY